MHPKSAKLIAQARLAETNRALAAAAYGLLEIGTFTVNSKSPQSMGLNAT